MKRLFKGKLNWQGEIHTLFRFAHSIDQAKKLMIKSLAKTLDLNWRPLSFYFNGDKDNFKIEEIK